MLFFWVLIIYIQSFIQNKVYKYVVDPQGLLDKNPGLPHSAMVSVLHCITALGSQQAMGPASGRTIQVLEYPTEATWKHLNGHVEHI